MNLNTNTLHSHCSLQAQDVVLECVEETASTNADLLMRCAVLREPVLRVAERQTAGRGRAGRNWLSEGGEALTFSLAWHFPSVQSLTGLPLAVGVMLAECLRRLAVPVQLKWPNDILRDGKKLAGILVESGAASDGGVWAVIGVGLNLHIPHGLEAKIGREVADAIWLAQMERNKLLAELLNALCAGLHEFYGTGFPAFAARWNALHAYAQCPVNLIDAGQLLAQGVAVGVDHDGRLLLQTASGVQAVLAGDVSLRLQGA